MKSEKAAPKFHTDDVSLSRSYSDTSLVWNFFSRSFDVILRETSCSVGKYQLFSHSPKLGGRGGGGGGGEKLRLAIKTRGTFR